MVAWLFTIEATLVLIAIILVTLILFGIVAYAWDKHGYKYTLDRLERRFMGWHPCKKWEEKHPKE